jgi:hypothetical protein
MLQVVASLLLFAFSGQALALDFDQTFTGPSSSEAEYFNINREKRMLIQVNFLGGVQRPGIHHVPDNLNLLEAISLAGGVQNDADPSKVVVRRKKKDGIETMRFDIRELLSDNHALAPELRNSDTVLIESRSHPIDNFVLGLTIVGSLIAIASGYLIIANKR